MKFVCALSLMLLVPVMVVGQIVVPVAKRSQVTVGVFDRDGALVRELVRGRWVDSGRQQFSWDGLTMDGARAENGPFSWKAVANPGFTARLVGTFGASHPDGKWQGWIGNHGGPGAVTADRSGIYVGGLYSEGHMLLGLSQDGQQYRWRQMQYYEANGNTRRLALSKDYLLHLQVHGESSWLHYVNKDRGGRRRKVSALWREQVPGSMDAVDNVIVLSYPKLNAVRWIEAGTEKELGFAQGIPGAGEITLAGRGSHDYAFVAGEGGVYRVSRAKSQPEMIFRGNDRIIAMDVNHADQSLFMAVANETESKILRVRGRQVTQYGGPHRPDGHFDDYLLAGITDLATTGDGHLVVTENANPRRTLRMNIETGEIVDQWYGDFTFYSQVEPEPDRPNVLWNFNEYMLCQWLFDLETGLSRPLMAFDVANATSLGPLLKQSVGNLHDAWMPQRRNGKLYLFGSRYPTMLEVDEKEGKLIARSFCGLMDLPLDQAPEGWVQAARRKFGSPENAPRAFSWADSNENGEIDSSEIEFSNVQGRLFGEGQAPVVDHRGELNGNLDYFWTGRVWIPEVFKMERKGWTGHNRDIPVWEWDKLERFARLPEQYHDLTWVRGLCFDEDENVFVGANIGSREQDRFEGRWLLGHARRVRIASWDKEGNLRFITGVKGLRPQEANMGRLTYVTDVVAAPRNTILVNQTIYGIGELYTADGLFMGGMLENRADDGLPDAAYAFRGDDYQNARIFENPDDGRIYFVSPDIGRQRVYEITGWDAVQHYEGRLQSPGRVPEIKKAGTGLLAEYFQDGRMGMAMRSEVLGEIKNFEYESGFREMGLLGPLEDEKNRMNHVLPIPGAGNPPLPAGYVFRVHGELEVPMTDRYTFFSRSEGIEGLKLWIDDKLVLPVKSGDAEVDLPAGRHAIRMEGTVPSAGARLEILWQSTHIDFNRLPSNLLYPLE